MSRAAVALVALGVLMGAKGQGCLPVPEGGGTSEEGGGELGEPPPLEPCPPGHHSEQVCDDDCGDEPVSSHADAGGYGSEPSTGEGPDCYEICVPDQPCPEGFYEDFVCEPSDPSWSEGPCPTPEGCGEPPPPPEACYPICVPDEDICPPGTYLDVECTENGCDEICLPAPAPEPR